MARARRESLISRPSVRRSRLPAPPGDARRERSSCSRAGNMDDASVYHHIRYHRKKPQSKVWFHGHTWWAALPTNAVAPTGTWLFRLEANNTWTPVLQLTSLKGKADTKAIGNLAHLLVAGPSSSQLVLLWDPCGLPILINCGPVRPTPTSVFVGEKSGTIERRFDRPNVVGYRQSHIR